MPGPQRPALHRPGADRNRLRRLSILAAQAVAGGKFPAQNSGTHDEHGRKAVGRQPHPQVVVPIIWFVPVPVGRTHVGGIVVPRPATQHATSQPVPTIRVLGPILPKNNRGSLRSHLGTLRSPDPSPEIRVARAGVSPSTRVQSVCCAAVQSDQKPGDANRTPRLSFRLFGTRQFRLAARTLAER